MIVTAGVIEVGDPGPLDNSARDETRRIRWGWRSRRDAELGDTVVSASDLETERATLLAILAASR